MRLIATPLRLDEEVLATKLGLFRVCFCTTSFLTVFVAAGLVVAEALDRLTLGYALGANRVTLLPMGGSLLGCTLILSSCLFAVGLMGELVGLMEKVVSSGWLERGFTMEVFCFVFDGKALNS